MRVCVLSLVFDAFRGGTHLPLFAALPDIEWTILTTKVTPRSPDLPPNVSIESFELHRSPFYYGIADRRFASAVLRKYPPEHPFWRHFDVLHLNQTMGMPFLRLRESGRPLLYLVHHPVSVDRALALQQSSGMHRLQWRAKYALLTRWQRSLCRTLPNIATVSQTVAQRIETDYGRKSSDIAVIPNGIDGDRFIPGDLLKSDWDVCAVGSFMHPRKGFPYLLQAYRLLAAKGYRIADVGRRTPEQNALLAAVPGVRILGTVSQEELLSVIQRSSALISTSLYEGFGLSLIEALACGRPAFAFDAGATGEVLRSIDPSLVIPINDIHALVARVESFLSYSPEERSAQGKTYRRQVLERYSLQTSAAALRSLYATLASPAVVEAQNLR